MPVPSRVIFIPAALTPVAGSLASSRYLVALGWYSVTQ